MTLNQLPASLKGLTDANRPIRLRLSTEQGVADDLLLVKHVSGVEAICGGIEYRLLCVATEAGMPLKLFNAMPVELQFITDSGGLRSVCGIIAPAVEGESDGGLATYQLIVRDALAIMEKRINTRVFRNASEVDITSTILREWQQANPVLARAFDFVLGHVDSYPAREFTMQYNESDAAFLRRLWKRRGLAWFFQPGKASETGSNGTPAHTLILFDDAGTLKQNAAGIVRYHRDDGTETRDSITAWHSVRTLTAGSINRQSWDYAQAWSMASQVTSLSDQGSLGNQFAASLDDYLIDVPHAGDDGDDYRNLGTLRMQRHEYESKYFQAESGVRDLRIGQWIGVTGHAEIDQLRLDDTPAQVSAQLASEHGHSQLNLGYLTHPRNDGKGEARGDGAELRSDQAVAIRGGQGVYISADARLRAAGRQLARDGLTGLSEALKDIQKQLSELAASHHADETDSKPLSQLAAHLKQWENGSNTEAVTPGASGGQAIVAIDAPAGTIVGSGDNIAIGAQTHVDIVSIGNTQVSAGHKLLMRATDSISLFAHKLGMKLIAASGKVEIQTHQDNIELTSAKCIVLSASDEIVIQAPKVSIITQGAQAAYGGGAITYQLSGAYAINSATFAHRGPGDSQLAALTLPKSAMSHDQHVRITDLNTGAPVANQRFRAKLEDGQEIEGTTDAQGLTQILKSAIPFGRYTIEAIND